MSVLRRLSGRVSSNALIKLTSEVIGRLATFALVWWAAHQLSKSGFGLYNYGLALGFVLAQIADLGLQVLITREVATADFNARPLVLAALRLKLLLSLPVLLLLAIFTIGWSFPLRLSLFCLGLVPLAQTYLEFVAYVFRGQQKLMVEALVLTTARLLTAVIGGLVLWLGGGLLGLALSSIFVVSSLAVWSLFLLKRVGWLDSLKAAVNLRSIKQQLFNTTRLYRNLIQQALPLGIAIFLSIAYTRLAILLLQYRSGEVAVAQFSIAHRLVEPMQIIPASLIAAVFPAFTYALHHDPPQARQLGTRVSLLLVLLGGGIATAFWLVSPWLVPLLYGESFVDSVPVLQILGLSAVPAFINYSLTHYLIARGQQLYIGLFTGTMLVLHGALSWYLVPLLGVTGPAVSIILAESLLLLGCLFILGLTKPATVPIPSTL